MHIKTLHGNDYYFAPTIPQILLIHPIAVYLLSLVEQGIELEKWINQLDENPVEIEAGIKAAKEEFKYYYRYLLFLEKNHYFAKAKKYELSSTRYDADSVKTHLANTNQIVYGATHSCNLKCLYCGFGEFYTGYDSRVKKNIELKNAKTLFDYMTQLFESGLCRKLNKKVTISFYGGEPLLNMPFIEEMVAYVKSKKVKHKDFCFSMTTNGVLLDKNLEFLVENRFHLLISLDGDERGNSYRVFPGGSSSFKKVFANASAIKEKYPGYFEKFANFNAVLHDRNSHKELTDFFRTHFGKDPLISEIKRIGIHPSKREEFDKLFKKMYTGLEPREIIKDIKDNDRILKTPFVKRLSSFLNKHSGFVFKKYDQLHSRRENARFVLTGTCNPFERKIFMDADGKIFPCERIEQQFSLGRVDKSGVHLDFQEIADKYNEYYKKMMTKCNACYNDVTCPLCIFFLDLDMEHPICPEFQTEEKYKRHSADSMSLLEETPRYYPRIMKYYQTE
jgi:uncharacterized protein